MFKHPAFGRMSPPEPIYSVYQPIFRLGEGKIMGYEALIRGAGKTKLPEQLFRAAYEQGYAILFDLKCLETSFGILPHLEQGQLLFVNVEPMTLGYAFRERKEADRLLKKNGSYLERMVFECAPANGLHAPMVATWDYQGKPCQGGEKGVVLSPR